MSIKIVKICFAKLNIRETDTEGVYIVRRGLLRRVYIDHVVLYKQIRQVLKKNIDSKDKFPLICNIIEFYNDTLEDFNSKDEIQYSYVPKDNAVIIKVQQGKEEEIKE